MKFMVTWQLHEDKRHEVLKQFSQMGPEEIAGEMGDKVKLIGRWHHLASFTGVAIAESDDPQAVFRWALTWNGVMDLEVTPVLDDAETRAVGKDLA